MSISSILGRHRPPDHTVETARHPACSHQLATSRGAAHSPGPPALVLSRHKNCTPGAGPVKRKGNAMNTRSPYPDIEVPEVSLPGFVLDRADERGAAVPLMGPADRGSASPLMGPAAAGTIPPLMGLAATATVTPLLGPADGGAMVSLMGPAGPGTAAPLMRPSRNTSRRPHSGRLARPGRRPADGPGRPGWEQITVPGDRR